MFWNRQTAKVLICFSLKYNLDEIIYFLKILKPLKFKLFQDKKKKNNKVNKAVRKRVCSKSVV